MEQASQSSERHRRLMARRPPQDGTSIDIADVKVGMFVYVDMKGIQHRFYEVINVLVNGNLITLSVASINGSKLFDVVFSEKTEIVVIDGPEIDQAKPIQPIMINIIMKKSDLGDLLTQPVGEAHVTVHGERVLVRGFRRFPEDPTGTHVILDYVRNGNREEILVKIEG